MLKTYLNEIKTLLQDAFPEILSALNPGASEERLDEIEARLGTVFPEDLRNLYRLHDGERADGPGLFFGLRFLTLDELISERGVWAGLEEDYGEEGEHYSVPAGWIKEQYINRGWLPISEDGGGNHLGVDTDPGDLGISGQIINFGRDEEVKYVVARRLSDLLQFIRDKVREEAYSIHRDDEYVHWTYDREGEVHFLDALRSMELPVLEPVAQNPENGHEFAALDEQWEKLLTKRGSTADALRKAKQLLFMRSGLTGVEPLRHCLEVRELVLSMNEIRDIEPLTGCKQLKVLYLGGNPIQDLKPLQSLPELQKLILTRTEVRDLSPLCVLPKLKELNVEHTQPDSLTPLQSIKSLRSLSVSSPDSGQIREIAALRSLTHLSISGFEVLRQQDMEPLGNLAKLLSLELENETLDNLDFLRSCGKLSLLKLKAVSVEDIHALAELTGLKELTLEMSPQIGRLESIADSPSLSRFTGSYQQFNILKDLAHRHVDFSSMIGEMTEEESGVWRQFLKDRRA
ncbi:SMI1/KNR4 family protein [Paenibacillus nasutitermitis]|uniref:Knr4/Smi1-like domain-containing protein n=1 Tax=Paenibacillus nasutitermitis TaxID=1652958 RepID=A0A917DZR7_9BACL|nr:SMI1/KNR4 family protein [Paenibacillus nasutitermitis]GGD86277.1 hypothetical protein GCM10010911_50890 [Paenibacillus nasutitermitis]